MIMANIISGVTEKGFAFNIDKNNLDDIELLEMMKEIDKGNILNLPTFVEKILGKNQKEKLYDFYRDENGKVALSTILMVVKEIMFYNNETKNS